MTDLDMVGECVAVAMKAAKAAGATECNVRVCGEARGVTFHIETLYEDLELDVGCTGEVSVTWEKLVSDSHGPAWAMGWEVHCLCRDVRAAFGRARQREREYAAKCEAEDADCADCDGEGSVEHQETGIASRGRIEVRDCERCDGAGRVSL